MVTAKSVSLAPKVERDSPLQLLLLAGGLFGGNGFFLLLIGAVGFDVVL